MPDTSKLKIKRDKQIYTEFKNLFFKRQLQHEACLQKLSDKYFIQPETIARIVQNQKRRQSK